MNGLLSLQAEKEMAEEKIEDSRSFLKEQSKMYGQKVTALAHINNAQLCGSSNSHVTLTFYFNVKV